MDLKGYKVLNFPRYPETELIGNLVLPSTMHAYSLCVEYVKEMFLDMVSKGYNKDYFKSIYVDGKHLFDEYVNMDDVARLRKEKPSLAIVPKIDMSYNNENQYMKLLGLDRYIRKGALYSGFFYDFDNNRCINVEMKRIQVTFEFTIRLATRAQQIDMYDYLRMACRIGMTDGSERDMDFHLPYGLMIRLAKDAGFEVENDKVKNPMIFLRYLNSNSTLPILYKMRGLTGKEEYFIRIKDCYIHTRFDSIDSDDGEKTGQISTNFNINIGFTCTFPCPSFYIYYSKFEDNIPIGEMPTKIETGLAAYAIKITKFADVDEHGWNLTMTTDIEEDDHSKMLEIDLEWLFKSDNDYNDIYKMIQYCKDNYISPEVFINFKMFNMGDPVPIMVNWNQMVIRATTPLKGDINSLAIYLNYGYINEQLAVMEKYYEKRLE